MVRDTQALGDLGTQVVNGVAQSQAPSPDTLMSQLEETRVTARCGDRLAEV